VLIGAITVLYCAEVVTRYFLPMQTGWTAAVAPAGMTGARNARRCCCSIRPIV
jgi:hypothetical protein